MATKTTAQVRALSLLDAAFFLLEVAERPSNVGPLMILQPRGGARGARVFADRLLRDIVTRPIAPPFDMIYQAPGWRGLPKLVRAASVKVTDHCHRHTLPARGTDTQLFEAVCRIHERRLDRSRPLWELHVIDGLARGRVAVYMKIHHGMIDGRGMQAAFDRFFNTSPDDRRVHAPWEPGAKETGSAPGLPARQAAVARQPAQSAELPKSSLLAALGRQAQASLGRADGMPLPFFGTPAAIKTAPSVRRCLAYCLLPLQGVRDFAHRHDAKVNDVMLTILDMAMNAYLGRRDGSPLVADMPVALAGASGGNALAILQFPLGAPAASPLERLEQVRLETAKVKAHVRQTGTEALVNYTALVHAVPAVMELLNISRAPVLANAVISNPGGYTEKRYVAGAELEIGLPVSVLAPGQALNITVATYDRNLQVAFLALESSLPDIQRLADLTVNAFDELQAAAAPRRRARAPRAAKTAKAAAPERRSRKGARA
jgi:WS/DGAT/MGAT family acyltransferase